MLTLYVQKKKKKKKSNREKVKTQYNAHLNSGYTRKNKSGFMGYHIRGTFILSLFWFTRTNTKYSG